MPDRSPELSTAAFRVPASGTDSLALRPSRDLAEAMDGTLGTTTQGPTFSAPTLPSSAPGSSATSTPSGFLQFTVTPSAHGASGHFRSQLI